MRHFTTQSLAMYICKNLYDETNLHTFMFKNDLIIFASSENSILGQSFCFENVTPSIEDDIMLFPAFHTIKSGGIISITYNDEPVFSVGMEGELSKIRTTLRMLFHFVNMWLGFRERLLSIEKTHKLILENIKDGYYEVDLKGNLTFFNSAFKEMIGYSEFELLGMNYKAYTSKETSKLIFTMYNNVYKTRKASEMLEFQYIKKDGETFNAEVSINLINDEANKPIGFCGIVRDITERKKSEELINFYAYHDPLTELPNRRYFESQLKKAINEADERKKMLAVLFIDLDGFKQVNDTLGHSAGDKLLQQIANRLTSHRPDKTVISRLGGDEFTILIHDLDYFHEVYVKTKSILELFQKNFTISGVNFTITASIGVSLYPTEGKTPEELMINADLAMYKAKQTGKNTFRFYGHLHNSFLK
ncbi:diguanylate cyclase domain-containing protein [Pueribacillus sp. YX66]|uniref:sensor domain-containing protein n=1 Tax=Pueribacillus sp. YX66 TaxID=3229242 RepID=UPI00358D4C91